MRNKNNQTNTTILEEKQIKEQTTKEIFLAIMADKYSRMILEATIHSPKSARELSANCQIPKNTAYRKVKELYSYKLLRISGSFLDNGKKHFLYKSNIKAIMTCFKEDSLEIEFVPNS